MKRFLLWISLWFTAMSAAAQTVWTDGAPFVFDAERKACYALYLKSPKADVTGISVIRREENRLLGSVVNEFGLKAFDFVYDARRQRVKLLNVAAMLDKWYIRKVLKKDLRFLFSCRTKRRAGSSRTLSTGDADGCITLENRRFGITYRFTPMMPADTVPDSPEEPVCEHRTLQTITTNTYRATSESRSMPPQSSENRAPIKK